MARLRAYVVNLSYSLIIFGKMLKVEVIGNLGADAEKRISDGAEFVTFRVCHSMKRTNKANGEIVEESTWISCTLTGNGGNLLPFLLKGQKVFVRGNASLKVYTSSKDGLTHAGLNMRVSEIELCGGFQQQGAAVKHEDGTDVPY